MMQEQLTTTTITAITTKQQSRVRNMRSHNIYLHFHNDQHDGTSNSGKQPTTGALSKEPVPSGIGLSMRDDSAHPSQKTTRERVEATSRRTCKCVQHGISAVMTGIGHCRSTRFTGTGAQRGQRAVNGQRRVSSL